MGILDFLRHTSSPEFYNEKTFYAKFLKDLECARKSVLIESPYITSDRMEVLTPVFQRILKKGVGIQIVTRDPIEHENELFRHQATNEILVLAEMGVNHTLLRGFHHRKLGIIDNKILWIGSLNILSHSNSIEIMTRHENSLVVRKLNKVLD